MKKIDVVLFQISNIGGIKTHAVELRNGLRDLGYDSELLFISASGRSGFKNVTTLDRAESNDYDLYVDKLYGYKKDADFLKFEDHLKSCDALIFENIPHLNKSFTETNWQKVFTDKVKNLLIYHDTLVRSYMWVMDIQDRIYANVGVQEKTKVNFEELRCDAYDIIWHPINTEKYEFNDDIFNKKEDIIIAPHNWKNWKRLDKVLESIYKEEHKNILHTFSCGIQRRKMSSKQERFKEEYKIWEGSLKTGKHIYNGVVSRPVLDQFFRKAKGVLDISVGERGKETKKPNINYTLLEGMLCGCMPVICEHAYNFESFPQENKYVIEEDNILETIATCCNKAVDEYNDNKELLLKNRSFVKDNFDRKIIASKYIESLNKERPKVLYKKKKKVVLF